MQEFEYKVVLYKKLKKADADMNKLAEDGWHVLKAELETGTTNLVVVYERKYKA